MRLGNIYFLRNRFSTFFYKISEVFPLGIEGMNEIVMIVFPFYYQLKLSNISTNILHQSMKTQQVLSR